jgi:hypothetical protein
VHSRIMIHHMTLSASALDDDDDDDDARSREM